MDDEPKQIVPACEEYKYIRDAMERNKRERDAAIAHELEYPAGDFA